MGIKDIAKEVWPWRKNPWFETVLEAQRRAKKRLPPSVYAALVAGSERGQTPQDNQDAFAELEFEPVVAGHQTDRQLERTVLGIPSSMPVMISPTGVQAVDPEGEVAVARAAAARGIAMGLSTFASKPIEQVAAANENTFVQMYWTGDKDAILERVERARAAGAKGLITTTDWSFSIGRDWGSPEIPEKMDLKTLYKMAPEGALRPGWTLRWLKAGLPDLTVPNLTQKGKDPLTFFGAYGEWSQTQPPSWDDLKWLKEAWGGTFMVKGIERVDDAKRAVDIGADAISVSNHGGNNLDTSPATIRTLGPIADAVADQIEVLMDGGIRRGGDVAKALAMGAHAVLIGRAYLWGLAANGQTGVENVLDLLRMGLDSAVLGLGHKSVDELSRDDLYIPPNFERAFGVKSADSPAGFKP